MAQALIFLGTALTVLTLIHYYLWRRLIRDTTRTRRGRRVGTWTVVGLTVMVLGAFIGSRLLPHAVALPLSWAGYLWLAVMFYLLVTLAALEIPALIARLALRRRARRVTQPGPVRVGALAAVPSGAAVEPFSGAGPGDGDSEPDEGSLISAGRAGGSGGDGGSGEDGGPGAGQLGDSAASRRLFLSRAVAVTAGLVSVGLVGPGIAVALGPPRIKRVQIPLARLPRGADGLRIALVADIHLGPLRGISHTRRIVDMVNDLDADLVAVVGDLVDGSVAELGAAAAPLRELRARYGSYFVTGNHEYFSGHQEWLDEVTRLGLRVLRNERLELPVGLDLAGVNDVTGGSYGDGPDMAAAMSGRDPSRAVVMLAHQPIQAGDAARHGADLQLSGHTHGGQMVPFNLIVRAAQQPVVSGLGEVEGMPVYVTNGAGFWGPPVRVGAPPDISLVELRAP